MKSLIAVICILLFFEHKPLIADEGMWPVSEIDQIDLASKGLKIPVRDIYNPQGISLMNAIISLGGCTGSFVSADGLIITNHHCAFGAVQRASTTQEDYLTDGFLAKSYQDEIPAAGYTANILEFYKDISAEVLTAIDEEMSLMARSKAIEQKKKEILLQAEIEYPGKRAEIAEMFTGKTYVLFIYTVLKDIRLVYVPPLAIGAFGGETDNWVWPRHTGDFSFMRAYAAPDGSPAELSMENIPYKPKIHFQVEPQGVSEDDFVFVMGYPARTYRHRTSYYLDFEESVRMPYIADEFEKAIAVMEDFSGQDKEAALILASPIKGLSNRMKNYRGKLAGLARLHLLDKKRREEEALQAFIDQDTDRKQEFGNVLDEISDVYDQKRKTAQRDLLLENIIRFSTPIGNARTIFKIAENNEKPDIEREAAYMDRNIKRTKLRLFLWLKSYYAPAEKVILSDLLHQSQQLPAGQRIESLDRILSTCPVDSFVKELYEKSGFTDEKFLHAALQRSREEIEGMQDPAAVLMDSLMPGLKKKETEEKRLDEALSELHARLINIKIAYAGKDFIPDANSTMRLTYGHIRGYQPRDAVYYEPLSSFRGVIEKTTGIDPFITPPALIDLYRQHQFGQFYSKKLNGLPVAILYDTDTTGGNSGSPILNDQGKLIGVNFDRPYEATINDYAWSEEYSRSIGVDIRYVLWITQKFAGADHLLKEMNIPIEQVGGSD